MAENSIAKMEGNNYKTDVYKQQRAETKKMQTDFAENYQKMANKNGNDTERMKHNFENNADRLKAELEQKLIMLRDKHNETLISEKERMEGELSDLRLAHQAKMEEMKGSQKSDIDRNLEQYTKIISDAREKFQREKIKLGKT
ncbi:MAG: hypothetical protein WCG27_01500 [Pseudomonadota bacterium]